MDTGADMVGGDVLKIAVVGGGTRCLSILKLINSQGLKRLRAEVVGVADLNPQAVGFVEAERRGIFTTTDYRRLLELSDLDLIVELTGKQSLLSDLVEQKPDSVEVIDYNASLLFHDIASFGAELERKEEEISVERSFARALTQATNEGVMVLDPEYRILRINEAACRWAGLGPEEAHGKFCFQVLVNSPSPCDSPSSPCPMRQTLSTGKSAHAIHEFSDEAGNSHYCDVSTYPLLNSEGEMVQVLEMFRDITFELASRVEMRAQAIKKDLTRLVQEDKLLALGKLVASVAHEINNPIASILNLSKLMRKTLEDGPLSREDRQNFMNWLDLTVDEAERSAGIVRNLLSFARQESLEPRRLDLRELMEQILKVTRHRMDLGGVELACRMPGEPLEAWGDAGQIQQCFANLIFNALEAMPEGGRLTIRGGSNEAGEVWVEVSDTGHGMTREVMGRIFEPFFTTKSEVQGVGLGLSMVYGIISEHRGRIDVDSQPGKGATFRITLPTPGREPGQEGAS